MLVCQQGWKGNVSGAETTVFENTVKSVYAFGFLVFFFLCTTWLDCTFYQARSNNVCLNQLSTELDGIYRVK